MEYIIIILILCFPITLYFMFQKGKKRGASDFFKLIAAFGYESKVKTFKSLNTSALPNGHVFVGDSITQDFNVYEAFKGHVVYNRGIGGDTTLGVLDRLNVSVFDLHPNRVFILIGTNDFALLKTTPDEVFHRIQKIVHQIYQIDSKIETFVLSILPVNETLDSTTVLPRKNKDIDAVNHMLVNIKNATFLDLSPIFKDKDSRLQKELTMEGLHLSPLGYQALTDALKPFIK